MRRYMIGAVALLVVGGGAAAYFVVQHNNDVAHAMPHAKAVR
jgi:hypothetical protein